MLPDVLAQPHAAHRPHAVAGGIDGRRAAPEVGVVVGHPAGGSVVQFRRFGAVLGQVFDQVEERSRAFGEVGDLGGPVVHLRVDVERVFAAPVGKQVLAPAALQVAGLAADGSPLTSNLSTPGLLTLSRQHRRAFDPPS